MSDIFTPVADMTFAELLEAVALNSDLATYLDHKPTATDDENDANRTKATRYFVRRAECMRELQKRYDNATTRDTT